MLGNATTACLRYFAPVFARCYIFLDESPFAGASGKVARHADLAKKGNTHSTHIKI
jgi:hypothetical protein